MKHFFDIKALLQQYLQHVFLIHENKILLQCGLLFFLILSVGAIEIHGIYRNILATKDKIILLQKHAHHNRKSNAACDLVDAKVILNHLEIGANQYDLMIHAMAPSSAPDKSLSWKISGNYHNIVAWLNFIAEPSYPIALSRFRLYRETDINSSLFFNSEIKIYENICS